MPKGGSSVAAVYFFGALGELLFGYDVGVIGVALIFMARDLRLGPWEQGVVVSSLLAGAAVGVGCAGFLADRFGRKPVILAMALVFALGGLAGALAPTALCLIAARTVMGVGVGASAVVVMIYLAELAPTAHRGRLASLGQLMVVSGILLAYIVDYLLAPWGAWRWMIGLSVVPSTILLLGMMAMPESPRWLIQMGWPERARAVLVRIGRATTADAELAQISAALAHLPPRPASFRAGLRRFAAPGLRRVLATCCVLAVMVQLLGVNTVVYYAPKVLIQVGFGQQGAIAANLGVGAVNVVLTIWALLAIDRLGRRRLLLTGTSGMIVAMFGLGLLSTFPPADAALVGWGTLGGLLLFLGSFAMSWGVCVRVVISELLPQSIRGAGMGAVLVLNWAANFCVGLLFPVMLARLGTGTTFLVFAGIGLAALLFIVGWVPETGGRSLEEIQEKWTPPQ